MIKKVYKKESHIKDAGLGLYAGEDIKKGQFIAEFQGKKVNRSDVTDEWSVLVFDYFALQCNKRNLASYANDIIMLIKKRNITKILKYDEPFYTNHKNCFINAEITQSDTQGWLKAITDIKKDEEIFVHYSLVYWINYENKINNKLSVLPKNIFKTKSFKKYVKIFYPSVTSIKNTKVGDIDVVLLNTGKKSGYIIGTDMLSAIFL
jgi:hypothetical protein